VLLTHGAVRGRRAGGSQGSSGSVGDCRIQPQQGLLSSIDLFAEAGGLSIGRFSRFTGRWRDNKDAPINNTTDELADLYRAARRS
jgi:hypothetical protein